MDEQQPRRSRTGPSAWHSGNKDGAVVESNGHF